MAFPPAELPAITAWIGVPIQVLRPPVPAGASHGPIQGSNMYRINNHEGDVEALLYLVFEPL
jgi:hypothetical protein